jgi:hypothetical protein
MSLSKSETLIGCISFFVLAEGVSFLRVRVPSVSLFCIPEWSVAQWCAKVNFAIPLLCYWGIKWKIQSLDHM